MSEHRPTTDDPASELATAADALEAAQERVADHGEETVGAVADAHERATDLLKRYEGRATGTGDFKAYVEFQGEFADLVEDLPDDLPERDAFERAEERIDKRRIGESDFERARADLESAAAVADLLDERAAARERYRQARRDVRRALEDAKDEIAERERLLELGDADLSAPVKDLRDPIEAYDDAVSEAFESFRRESSAREVLDFVAATREYPLVEFRQPPDALREYVRDSEAGEKSLPDLLKFGRYSNSKLDHYVADPAALKRAVATNETYLERLDAGPLRLDWPPRAAADLRWRIEELVSVVAKFAPEEVVARLREVRALTRDEEWFERLRTAARARQELTDEERERLASGAVERELTDLRERKETLEAALAEYPERE